VFFFIFKVFFSLQKCQHSFIYSNTTELPQVRTIRYSINSFRYTASKLWNELPEHFRNETNVNQFSKLREAFLHISEMCLSNLSS
jgi:isocitrate lyase